MAKDFPKAQDDHSEQRDSNGRFLPGHDLGFKKGQSGNPGGRKKKPITEELQRLLETVNPEDPDKRTNAKLLADKLIEMAQGGRLDAIQEVANRAEGKPTASVEVSGADGGPIEIDPIAALNARISAIRERRGKAGNTQ